MDKSESKARTFINKNFFDLFYRGFLVVMRLAVLWPKFSALIKAKHGKVHIRSPP